MDMAGAVTRRRCQSFSSVETSTCSKWSRTNHPRQNDSTDNCWWRWDWEDYPYYKGFGGTDRYTAGKIVLIIRLLITLTRTVWWLYDVQLVRSTSHLYSMQCIRNCCAYHVLNRRHPVPKTLASLTGGAHTSSARIQSNLLKAGKHPRKSMSKRTSRM